MVIPNWNGRELLADFFPSLIAAANCYRDRDGSDIEIIVVDDGSTDGSVEWLSANFGVHDFVRVLRHEQNQGLVYTANKGVNAACHSIVFLLNNDVRVDPDAIAPLVRHFDDPSVFAVCPKAYRLRGDFLDGAGKVGYFKRGFWRVYQNYDILPSRLPQQPHPFHSFFASSGYAAYDATKFHALGGFSEMLAPMYWDDVEICYRAWKRGWTVHYEPASVVHHKGGATMGKPHLRRPMRIVSERNRLLMNWVNLHDKFWLATHIAWIALKLLGAVASLNTTFLKAFWQAIARLPDVREARNRERALSVRSDREIAAIFARLSSSEWTSVMLNVKDYPQYLESRRRLEDGLH
jgi:GT2 family glycosyltransferase